MFYKLPCIFAFPISSLHQWTARRLRFCATVHPYLREPRGSEIYYCLNAIDARFCLAKLQPQMDSEACKQDEHQRTPPDTTIRSDSGMIHTAIKTADAHINARESSQDQPPNVTPEAKPPPALLIHPSGDSGILTEDDSSSAQQHHESETQQAQDDQEPQGPVPMQLAEEQELVPDVRHIPKRHRRRKRLNLSHEYVLLTGDRRRLCSR